jgi:Lon protease-like protein
LAVIEEMTQPQAGLLLVRCRGIQRFEIEQKQLLKHGLWVADVTLLPNDPPTDIPTDLSITSSTLKQVVTNLHAQYNEGQHIPIQPPYHWDDAGWVANRWCELLPVPLELKQRLMALDNPLVRLELVNDLLDKLKLKGQ